MSISILTRWRKAFTTDSDGNDALRTVISGDQDLGGGYILNDQTTTNMRAKGTVYRFDGVNDKIVIPHSAEVAIVGDLFVMVRFSTPDVIPSAGLFAKGQASNNNREWGVFISPTEINFQTTKTAGGYFNALSDEAPTANTEYCVIGVISGTTGTLYINGIAQSTTFTFDGTRITPAHDISIGAYNEGASGFYSGEISEALLGNFAPTAAEVKDLISGNIPFKWQYGSQTAQTSGTLTIGKTYIIDDWITADDFTNVGGLNVDGTVFIATGTTPTTWTNSSSLRPLGAVALYDQTSMNKEAWVDLANGNAGVITGCELLNISEGQAVNSLVFTPTTVPAAGYEGEVRYNTATNKLNVWTGAAWEAVTSA
jgi:hypothetical protein